MSLSIYLNQQGINPNSQSIRKVFQSVVPEADIHKREKLIIDLAVNFLNTKAKLGLQTVPYGLYYGIIDWAWALRFQNHNGMRALKYYSEAAVHHIINDGDNKELKRDHYYPKTLMHEDLKNLNPTDAATVRTIFNTCGEVCCITKAEHNKLRDANLNQQMPMGWAPGRNLFERYNTVGINYLDNDLL